MARAHKRPHEKHGDFDTNYPPGLPLKVGKRRPFFTPAAGKAARDQPARLKNHE